MHFQVALKLRNFSELQDRLAAGEQVAYPELEQQYLPTAQDYASVVAWLRGEGLTIERTVPDRMTVAAGGTVASVSRALGASFSHIISEGQEYDSANSAPHVPAALSGIVASVNGLQPHLHMNKLSILNPQTTSGFSPAGIRDAYAATGLSETGANTTTAIIIDTHPKTSDLKTFWKDAGVPQSLSNIKFINVEGGTLPAPSGEETIDTEWSSSVAPGSKVRVYATTSLSNTDVDNGYEAIIYDITANGFKITQVSISLGLCEALEPKGEFLTDLYYHAILSSLGASVLVATGDQGSTGCFPNDKSTANVADFAATSPDVTAVGGTTLELNSNGSVKSETAWSGCETEGSGGGLSSEFVTPSYQTSLRLPKPRSSGRGRGRKPQHRRRNRAQWANPGFWGHVGGDADLGRAHGIGQSSAARGGKIHVGIVEPTALPAGARGVVPRHYGREQLRFLHRGRVRSGYRVGRPTHEHPAPRSEGAEAADCLAYCVAGAKPKLISPAREASKLRPDGSDETARGRGEEPSWRSPAELFPRALDPGVVMTGRPAAASRVQILPPNTPSKSWM